MRASRPILLLVLVIVPFWLAACGGPDPEADLVAASEELAAARSTVEAAKAVVEQRQGVVSDANAQLDASRQELREAEERLARAASQVDVRATDDVLFRSVQRRLLEDGELEDVAVAATVSNGTVTLSGRVPNGGLADRAEEIANDTPGVVRVESLIEVDIPAVAAPPEG
jgi:osmotically-inducible protein OsmY